MKRVSLTKQISILLLFVFIAFSCRKDIGSYADGTPGDGALVGSVTVDTSIKKIDVSKYAQARVFPGLVCATEPRLNNLTLAMNLNYNYVGNNLRMSVAPQPQFSTGLYAAPGELVIIDVPLGDYSLSVQIGAWTDNLTNIQNAPRDPNIVSKMQLAPGRNYIRNLYGGHIYIYAGRPIKTPVNMVFTNVVKSPDFVLGETSNADWQAAIAKSCVPYLELRSKNMIFVVPTAYCVASPIPDPTALMKEWDDAINFDYYQWEGLVANPATTADSVDLAPLLPWRVVQDIKPSAGYGHNGYPVVTFNDYGWFNEFTRIEQIRNGNCWGTFHELGHNNQQGTYWSWSSLGETSNNLFSFKVAHRQEATYPQAWPPKHPALAGMWPGALAFALDPDPTKSFDGTDARINDPFARILPFVQIFDKIPANWGYPGQPDGWSFMGALYKKARRATRISLNDQDKRDFVYEALCDFTHKDWIYFFKAWGIQVSNISSGKMGNLYPVMNQEIWKYNPLTRTGGNTTFNPDPYARVNWSISSNSEALTGEPAPSGPATAVLDGNVNTYWHSNWPGGSVQPFTLTIDIGKAVNVNGFKFTQRQTLTRNIKNLKVEISTNGTTWTVVSGSPFVLQSITAQQTFSLPATVNCRYFRLTVAAKTDVYDGTTNAALAEVDITHP